MPERSIEKPKVGVNGVPFNKGQPKAGTDDGPRSLRDAGILERIENLGYLVNDRGDLHFDENIKEEKKTNVKNTKAVAEASAKIKRAVSSCLKSGETALVLGGDHSMAIGSILGHADAKPDLCVLWIDAHADINTPLTSDTGNMHGMPLAFLVKEVQKYIPKMQDFDDIQPCLSAKNLAYIGLRDVDPGERHIIESLGITAFSMHDVDRYGIKEVVEKALSAIDPDGNRSIHFSFDVDGLDPTLTPSTGTPVSGGLTLRESFYIAEEVAATGRVSVVEVTEVNPTLGTTNELKTTLSHTLQVVEKCFGSKRHGNRSPEYVFPLP